MFGAVSFMLMDCRRLVRAFDVFDLGTAIQNLSQVNRIAKIRIYVKGKYDISCACVTKHLQNP